MTNTGYPKLVAEVVSTLIEILWHQKQNELAEIVENAHAHFESVHFDNWNGGTTTWILQLEIPVIIYAGIHTRLEEIEKSLLSRLSYLNRINPNDPLEGVTITPLTLNHPALGQRLAPADTEVQRLWTHGYLRLFLSHVSTHKVDVSILKLELMRCGISGFVAHEDIEPSREWQEEISLALRSMHALAALITPDFHRSNWTDQEVGWALGRGIPVIPVKLGSDPYGFVGKIQATKGSLADPHLLAQNIAFTMLRENSSKVQMRQALVEAFVNSDSFASAKIAKDVLITIDDFTEEDKRKLWNACETNRQIRDSYGVVSAIHEKFGTPPIFQTTREDDSPF